MGAAKRMNGHAELICLTPEEQLAFWLALQEPVVLTPAQKKLGAMMRGEPTDAESRPSSEGHTKHDTPDT
jgi:hypothetical protein